MDTATKQRPQHRRNTSSKSNILRALVSPKSRVEETAQDGPTPPSYRENARTQTVPLLPPDHPHGGVKGRVLGERQNNAQSPPISPSKTRPKSIAKSKTSNDVRPSQSPIKDSKQDASASTKKSKSSTNLTGMFAKMNRSNKDLSTQVQKDKDKENTTPPPSSSGKDSSAPPPPIWAQYASGSSKEKQPSRPSTRDGINSSVNVREEIAKYTPKDYSPSKQRNFNGGLENPQVRPTLTSRPRPQSEYILGADIFEAIGRRVSGGRTSMNNGRKSEDLERRGRRVSGEKVFTERKISGSSTERAPVKEKLNIAKRGSRVMAAVAAFQGKTGKEQTIKSKEEAVLDEKAVDQAFESVLASRNVPEPMRQKMRSLTLRVKADFIKQNQEASKTVGSSPPGTASSAEGLKINTSSNKATDSSPTEAQKTEDDTSKSTKRTRARSRTFTFSKGDKRTDNSPSKKQRSQSKNRAQEPGNRSPTTPIIPRPSMDKRSSNVPAVPGDYITYLKKHKDPVKIEVGRLHKLRILLRNETVAWVDTFLSLGGMAEIVALLHRIMAVEWREDHEDQVLQEALLCLKGLCTTERAMSELEKVADELFPALIAMIFDDEKKGPAEYTTRGIVFGVLFNFLAAATNSPPEALEQRARRILTYLGESAKPEDVRPVDFVLDMRVSRPYKLWCREVTHVTKEVFWIFLHHMNVVPLPRPASSKPTSSPEITPDEADRAKILETTYTHRHFPPSTRPPVPAAPYIGGVEWDATTYITAHLDLLNGLIDSIPTISGRNALRKELKDSCFEKIMGATLRTCKEKFYSGVHDGLRAWVAAAAEDGWETVSVREGPTLEEQATRARSCSPKKSPGKKEKAPQIEAPKLEGGLLPKLDLGLDYVKKKGDDVDEDDGWLG